MSTVSGAKGFELKMVDNKPGTDSDRLQGREVELSCGHEPSRGDVWKMFDRIAARYDLLNRLLSANIDQSWRRRVARMLPNRNDLTVLDLATGTGDQLIALAGNVRVGRGVGVDLAERMLEIGRVKIDRRQLSSRLSLQHGDAQQTGLESDRFDAVTMAFGIRNMTDVRATLAEMYRVLKPGGRALVLEFSLPSNGLVRAAYLFYLRHLVPRLGAAISGDNGAYRYLNETVQTFPHGEAFGRLMTEAGFTGVTFTPLTLGVASIYRGDKP